MSIHTIQAKGSFGLYKECLCRFWCLYNPSRGIIILKTHNGQICKNSKIL
ncbi:hypothetical protein [uncultured Helicobacter sp.]